ncbi:MAG: sigma 54-interacting transcriptional regulator [Polyangiales bacterium]
MYLLTVLDGTGRTLVRPIDGPTSIDPSALRGATNARGPWLIQPDLVRGCALVYANDFEVLAELRPGQRATIGDVTALLTRAEASRTDRVVLAPKSGPIELRIPGRRPVTLGERPLLVGSWHGCDVVIEDPSVSHRHCEITPFGDAWAVWDLGSTNGLRVGGARVPYAMLDAGAAVTLGRTVIECAPCESLPEERSAIVGSSTAVMRLRARIAAVADAPYAVLIEGESGVGKELVAREIHTRSSKRSGSLVSVNCGAIAPELIESELFGHERGAFSGAAGRRRGLFEEAHEGTLFLDEIGELPMALQPKLLRVLETGEIRRVGGEGKIDVRVRVVSATLRDLEQRVRDGHFRDDLFFRLQDMRVKVPPLRERVSDIPMLADALLRRIADETGRRRALEDRAVGRLMLWHWPGNVRELFATLKRAVFATRNTVIGAADIELPDALPYLDEEPAGVRDSSAPRPAEIPHGDLAALHSYCNGNLTRVASLAGIARSTVRARLAKARAAGWSEAR